MQTLIVKRNHTYFLHNLFLTLHTCIPAHHYYIMYTLEGSIQFVELNTIVILIIPRLFPLRKLIAYSIDHCPPAVGWLTILQASYTQVPVLQLYTVSIMSYSQTLLANSQFFQIVGYPQPLWVMNVKTRSSGSKVKGNLIS